MFEITYKTRIMLDGFSCKDYTKSFKAKRVEFSGGIAYCFRSRFAYVAISEDEMTSIEDLENPHAYIDVKASFKAQELAYCLPF